MQNYLVNYESKKEDNTDNVAYFFKKLVIDILHDLFLDINTTNKLFLTQFGPLQNIKSANTVNTLGDNAYKRQITSTDITLIFINLTSSSFTTSTNMWYNNFKFKEWLINLDANTISKSGFSQLKALQRVFYIELDKTTARSTNFVFRIGNTSLINTFNLNIPLGMIVFYIVQVKIPFLLCFANMDKLKALFKYLTNQIFQLNYLHPVIY